MMTMHNVLYVMFKFISCYLLLQVEHILINIDLRYVGMKAGKKFQRNEGEYNTYDAVLGYILPHSIKIQVFLCFCFFLILLFHLHVKTCCHGNSK